jgi:hypothetical protein
MGDDMAGKKTDGTQEMALAIRGPRRASRIRRVSEPVIDPVKHAKAALVVALHQWMTTASTEEEELWVKEVVRCSVRYHELNQ